MDWVAELIAKGATVHAGIRTSDKHPFGPVDHYHLSAAERLGRLDDPMTELS